MKRRRREFVITTPKLSNHRNLIYGKCEVENTRRSVRKKTFNGLTVNMLDKCRQGLNLEKEREKERSFENATTVKHDATEPK